MKERVLIFMAVLLAIPFLAQAQRYDLRQYPSAGRGVVIMAADLPPSWFLDVWINPIVVGGQPQGPPSFTFIPHPSWQQRSREVEVGNDVGAIKAYAIAWELDRAGDRIVRAAKFPIVRYIGQVPDYNGYYWGMYIGLYELGVRSFVGSYY
jgi:hypothetical protein